MINIKAETSAVKGQDIMKFSNSDYSLDEAVEYIINEKGGKFAIPNPELLVAAIEGAEWN
jgi:hypothetical protein